MSKVDEKKPAGMDLSFIGQPHEWDPRRLYSQTGADWQYRVDFDRLRSERLAKLRAQMKADDIAALVLFAGANIRYSVLPANGEPVLFETAGSDLQCAKIDLPWMEDRIRPAITWQWAEGAVPYMAGRMAESVMDVLKEHGADTERIGIDNLDMPALEAFQKAGLNIVNGWPAISRARTVKTRDEIELLKQASSIGDAAMWKIKYEWLKPGVRERDIEAKVHEFMLERGCEIIYDINVVGPSGYFIDFVRCFKCGGPYGMKMTRKEIGLYREVYDSMYAGLENLRPGKTTADVARAFPKYDDDKYGTVTLQQFAHSIGITLYEGMWISRAYSLKYPAEIKENMYFAIETFAGHPGLEQTCRLEENVLVTAKGPVVFTRMEHMEEAMAR